MSEQHQLPANSAAGVAIETAWVRSRAYGHDDHTELVTLIGNWAVARWLNAPPHPYNDTNGRQWIAHVPQEHEAGRPRSFAIALKESDRLFGAVGLDEVAGDSETASLGYWLEQPYWGQKYGREAVAAIIGFGFRALQLGTIQAHTDPGNAASQRVLLACGLKRSGEIDLAKPTRNSGAMRAQVFRMSRQDGPSR
jgi:ribosomal-protein-alanine N-acetyltransferase